MRRLLLVGIALCGIVPASGLRAAVVSPEQQTFFESQVRPLLADNCISCHGEKKQKGGLRLDSLDAALKGGKNGVVLVPGKPEASKLVTAIGYKDADLQMPPDEQLPAAKARVLTEWVRMGAPWPQASAAIAGSIGKGKKRTITDGDRGFWSFQPVKDSAPPTVADSKWCRNPIDAFILARLAAEGLTPAPEADRATLIRRATFDLHGLPPTPAEVDAFVTDPSPGAYEALIDRLLASPRYGERYARHWLDLVRYAESDGFKQDAYRPNVWPYRDWVIRSLNSDKPYDRFIAQQLAGDELAPEDPDSLVATTYFRCGMYEYNTPDAARVRSESLNDITDVTSDMLMGLSMGCCRCHDHKFDPLLQSDYFRLQAFFAPLQPRDQLVLATHDQKAAYDAALRRWEDKTRDLRQQIAALEAQAIKNAEHNAVKHFPPETQAIWAKPAAERTPLEQQLAYYVGRQVADATEKAGDKAKEKEKLAALRHKLAEFDDEKPKPLQPAFVVTDIGPVAPPTTIPGDAQSRELAPGCPVVLDGKPGLSLPPITASAASTGRRTALAQWATEPSNPLTTRVMVNRLWQWHFGRGLVKTSSDFGRLGEPPTHPELLDWLTARFTSPAAADGLAAGTPWTMKRMHRLIMTSATYRQASVRAMPEVARLKDPENRWLWRMNARRLDSEQVRDAMLAVSGELEANPASAGGPAADPIAPRRSIYTKAVRNNRDPLLMAFDAPESFGSVPSRNVTTTATQALLMINGEFTLKRAASFATRLDRDAESGDPAARIDAAYRLAYGRRPTDAERAAVAAFLEAARNAAAQPGKPALASAADTGADAADRPLTQTMPHHGGEAIVVRNAAPSDMLRLPASSAAAPLPESEFTVEAFISLESIYPDANVRVIASQWDGAGASRVVAGRDERKVKVSAAEPHLADRHVRGRRKGRRVRGDRVGPAARPAQDLLRGGRRSTG